MPFVERVYQEDNEEGGRTFEIKGFLEDGEDILDLDLTTLEALIAEALGKPKTLTVQEADEAIADFVRGS